MPRGRKHDTAVQGRVDSLLVISWPSRDWCAQHPKQPVQIVLPPQEGLTTSFLMYLRIRHGAAIRGEA